MFEGTSSLKEKKKEKIKDQKIKIKMKFDRYLIQS